MVVIYFQETGKASGLSAQHQYFQLEAGEQPDVRLNRIFKIYKQGRQSQKNKTPLAFANGVNIYRAVYLFLRFFFRFFVLAVASVCDLYFVGYFVVIHFHRITLAQLAF